MPWYLFNAARVPSATCVETSLHPVEANSAPKLRSPFSALERPDSNRQPASWYQDSLLYHIVFCVRWSSDQWKSDPARRVPAQAPFGTLGLFELRSNHPRQKPSMVYYPNKALASASLSNSLHPQCLGTPFSSTLKFSAHSEYFSACILQASIKDSALWRQRRRQVLSCLLQQILLPKS